MAERVKRSAFDVIRRTRVQFFRDVTTERNEKDSSRTREQVQHARQFFFFVPGDRGGFPATRYGANHQKKAFPARYCFADIIENRLLVLRRLFFHSRASLSNPMRPRNSATWDVGGKA